MQVNFSLHLKLITNMKVFYSILLLLSSFSVFSQEISFTEWRSTSKDTIITKFENKEVFEKPTVISQRFVKVFHNGETYLFLQTENTITPIYLLRYGNSFSMYVYVDYNFKVKNINNEIGDILLRIKNIDNIPYDLQPRIVVYPTIRYNFFGATLMNYVRGYGYYNLIEKLYKHG